MNVLWNASMAPAGLAFVSALAFMIGPTVTWREYTGVVWGGAECEDCGEWEEQSVACWFQAEETMVKCYKYPNEELGKDCIDYECTSIDLNGDGEEQFYCDLVEEVRDYYSETMGAHRTQVFQAPGLSYRPCYENEPDSNASAQFCGCQTKVKKHGSSQVFEVNIPCFDVQKCITEIDGCNPHPNNSQMVCQPSSVNGTEGNESNDSPHPSFPCPTEMEVDAAWVECMDTYDPN